MASLPGYEILERLHEGTHSLIHRARRESDDEIVVLKQPVEASPAQVDLFIDDLTEGQTNNRPVQATNGRVIVGN